MKQDTTMKRISILGLGCLLICLLTSPSTFAQDKTEMSDSQTARGKGVVKFFNNTKGFGYISDDQEMDWLLERVAAMCGGPVTGCTFEVMDILRDIFGSN